MEYQSPPHARARAEKRLATRLPHGSGAAYRGSIDDEFEGEKKKKKWSFLSAGADAPRQSSRVSLDRVDEKIE
jgi:hypothetical protein